MGLIKYLRITGTFLNFNDGQRIQTGITYSQQELDLDQKQILVNSDSNGVSSEIKLTLEGPELLDYKSAPGHPTIPAMSGRFLSTDYEESVLSSAIPDLKVNITGTVTRLTDNTSVSVKTLTNAETGRIVGVMQEFIEFLSETEFKSATIIN